METAFVLAAALGGVVIACCLVFIGAPQRLIVITPALLAALPYLDYRLPHVPLVTPTRVFLLGSMLVLAQVPAVAERRFRSTPKWAVAYFVAVIAVTFGVGLSAQTIGTAVDLTLLPFLYLVVLYPRVPNLRLGHGTAIVATVVLMVEVFLGGREFETGTYFINYPQRADPLAYAGTDPSMGIRAVGTFVTTETYSLFCALLGLFLLAYWSKHRHGVLAVLCVAAAMAGCLFSGTRDTILFFVPLALLMFLRGGKSTSVRTVATALLTVPLLIYVNSIFHPLAGNTAFAGRAGNQGNIDTRIATYKAAWHIFLDHPLLGAGFGRYTEAAQSGGYVFAFHSSASVPFPHNTYLSVMAETGLVGAVLFAGLWLSILRVLRRDDARSFTLPVAFLLLLVSLGDNLGQQTAALNATIFLIGLGAYVVRPVSSAAETPPADGAAPVSRATSTARSL